MAIIIDGRGLKMVCSGEFAKQAAVVAINYMMENGHYPITIKRDCDNDVVIVE